MQITICNLHAKPCGTALQLKWALSENRKISGINKMDSEQKITNSVKKFWRGLDLIEDHRYKSWEHCYNFFKKISKKKLDEEELDLAQLHLAFYLASWGMYRGSSFILQKDYTIFKKIVVAGTFITSVAVGLSVSDISGKAIANLDYEKIIHDAPVFIGDTLHAETEILEVKESKTKPDRGIVFVETRAFNQNNEKVLTLRRHILIPKRGKK